MSIDISTLKYLDEKIEIKLSSQKSSFLKKEIELSLINKNRFKARFFQELSVLVPSGLDMKASLTIIERGFKKQKDKSTVKDILAYLINGGTLSQALKDNTKYFAAFDYHSVRIGEETGRLDSSTMELSVYYDNKIKQAKNLKGALSYPILVLTTTMLSLGFMLRVIVPMFEDVFKRFQGELPSLTKGIIGLSEFAKEYFVYFLITSLIGAVLITLYRKKPAFRRYSSKMILKIPIISSITLLNYKTRYCQSLRLLSSSNVPLMESIKLIGEMIGFYPFEVATRDIATQLGNGSTLSGAMKDHFIFDSRMIALTEVAEEVNNLELVYDQLFTQYSNELDLKIKTLNSLLEPILIIGVGAMVAIMLISMYLPIFQIGIGLQ